MNNMQSVSLYLVIWFIQKLHGTSIAARMEQAARTSDRVEDSGHTLIHNSGVWWYTD
jgi:hypothetical protein